MGSEFVDDFEDGAEGDEFVGVSLGMFVLEVRGEEVLIQGKGFAVFGDVLDGVGSALGVVGQDFGYFAFVEHAGGQYIGDVSGAHPVEPVVVDGVVDVDGDVVDVSFFHDGF
ncbi:hypothetical protein AT05_07300 [Schleiferia thermophila str. Yellowstone]|nr:hypothetical protein AT05_07300 [Schleiferia thermophila str. Yellowstone]